MVFRHEWKHEIDPSDLITIRQRLRIIARPDRHAADGRYRIRSLYFDTPDDTALREKINGVSRREKFRIRYYNGDTGFIRVERKSKLAGLGHKESAPISAEQARDLLDGRLDWLLSSHHPVLQDLYSKMTCQLLRPKTLVDYVREPFVYPPGNVRVTLDYDIRTGLGFTDFLDPDCPTVPVPGSPIILEVKWDEYLPDIIRDAVQLDGRHTAPYSKYASCRMYD